jgi:hypothetical protein
VQADITGTLLVVRSKMSHPAREAADPRSQPPSGQSIHRGNDHLARHGASMHSHTTMLDDTDPTARTVQFERLDRMSSVEKFAMVEQLTAMTTFVSREAIRATMPGASEQQVILRWIELVYGKELAAAVAPVADRLGRRGSA